MLMLRTRPYSISEVASGVQYDIHGVGVTNQLVYCADGNNVLEGVLGLRLTMKVCLPNLSFPACLTPLHSSPPFPPELLLHLPDVREVWEEPGGICVPQGPLFLLNCRETPHVLKNTSTHTNIHYMQNTLAALLHLFLKCLTS